MDVLFRKQLKVLLLIWMVLHIICACIFWLHYAMKFEMMCIHCEIESACMQLLGRKCQTVHYNRFTCMLQRNLLKVFLNTIGEKKIELWNEMLWETILVPQCKNRLLILNCFSYYRSSVFNSRRKTGEKCLK